jgi:hypothetical protein
MWRNTFQWLPPQASRGKQQGQLPRPHEVPSASPGPFPATSPRSSRHRCSKSPPERRLRLPPQRVPRRSPLPNKGLLLVKVADVFSVSPFSAASLSSHPGFKMPVTSALWASTTLTPILTLSICSNHTLWPVCKLSFLFFGENPAHSWWSVCPAMDLVYPKTWP